MVASALGQEQEPVAALPGAPAAGVCPPYAKGAHPTSPGWV